MPREDPNKDACKKNWPDRTWGSPCGLLAPPSGGDTTLSPTLSPPLCPIPAPVGEASRPRVARGARERRGAAARWGACITGARSPRPRRRGRAPGQKGYSTTAAEVAVQGIHWLGCAPLSRKGPWVNRINSFCMHSGKALPWRFPAVATNNFDIQRRNAARAKKYDRTSICRKRHGRSGVPTTGDALLKCCSTPCFLTPGDPSGSMFRSSDLEKVFMTANKELFLKQARLNVSGP